MKKFTLIILFVITIILTACLSLVKIYHQNQTSSFSDIKNQSQNQEDSSKNTNDISEGTNISPFPTTQYKLTRVTALSEVDETILSMYSDANKRCNYEKEIEYYVDCRWGHTTVSFKDPRGMTPIAAYLIYNDGSYKMVDEYVRYSVNESLMHSYFIKPLEEVKNVLIILDLHDDNPCWFAYIKFDVSKFYVK